VTTELRGQAAYAEGAHHYEARTRQFHEWRRRVVDLLPLRRGDVVLDVGCGSGLCFPLLQPRVGPQGMVVGVEPSTDMLALAATRVQEAGWRNVLLVEAAAEDAKIPGLVDHVLFCAVHDVLQSREALRNVLGRLRPGGTVAVVGGKWAPAWAIGLNAVVAAVHAPFVRDFAGFDRPWGLLAEHVPNMRVSSIEMDCGFLAVGQTAGADGKIAA
jgi:ubiquinone/menaquinone biosynthesis C-methylase UbiE